MTKTWKYATVKTLTQVCEHARLERPPKKRQDIITALCGVDAEKLTVVILKDILGLVDGDKSGKKDDLVAEFKSWQTSLIANGETESVTDTPPPPPHSAAPTSKTPPSAPTSKTPPPAAPTIVSISKTPPTSIPTPTSKTPPPAAPARVLISKTPPSTTTPTPTVSVDADDTSEGSDDVASLIASRAISTVEREALCKYLGISNKGPVSSRVQSLSCKIQEDNKLDQYIDIGGSTDILYAMLLFSDKTIDALTDKAGLGKDVDRFTKIINIINNRSALSTTKSGKKNISKDLKREVWMKYVGPTIMSTCFCCGKREISNDKYEAGHIVAEACGGLTSVDNLRPICSSCNKSMGVENMISYAKRVYPDTTKL